MENTGQVSIEEVDVAEYTARGEPVPHGKTYKVRIDHTVTVDTRLPTGEMLLAKVRKKPCSHELIQELKQHKNIVIEPGQQVDLGKPGLERFITAHKEIVQIFITDDGAAAPKAHTIERGKHTVAEILALVGKSPDAYTLYEEKDGGPPLPVPANQPIKIQGCEVFHVQVQTGASS